MFKAGVVAGVVLFASLGAARAEDTTTVEEKKEPPRWTGSEVSLRHGFNTIGFLRNLEPTYNPVFAQGISIDPRWRLNKKINLTAHLGIETELTDSDVSTYKRQPLLEDTFVTGAYSLPKLPGKIGGSVALRLTLPTSKDSLARTMWFALGPSVSLSRPFELTKNISLTAFASFRANVAFHSFQELTFDHPAIAACDAGGSEPCNQFDHSGSRSPFATLNETIGVDIGLPYRLSGQVVVQLVQSWLYDLVDDPRVMTSPNNVNWRYVNVYLIELGWEPIKHVKASGGFQTVNPQLAPDSTYYPPFFNRYTEVFLKGAYVF